MHNETLFDIRIGVRFEFPAETPLPDDRSGWVWIHFKTLL